MTRHLPNLITSLNLLTGVIGIVWVFQYDHRQAIYFVMLAGVFDFLDGFAARMLKVQSPMGKELDSLADMVSFSTLPTLFLFVHLQELSFHWAAYSALLIAPFSALRLAKFNIDDRQSDKFIGLPTPANAIFVTSLYLIDMTLPMEAWILIALFSAGILVAPVEMIALKFKSFALRDNGVRYLLIVFVITIMAILGISGLVYVIPGYILLSIISNLGSMNRS